MTTPGGKSYHDYVFDVANRRFVGDFERMYQAEREAGFDSWHQDADGYWHHDVCLALVARSRPASLIDLGCGKGRFTERLRALLPPGAPLAAVDVSPTALATAASRLPGAQLIEADLNAPERWPDVGGPYDVVATLELLSYLERWPDVLAAMARVARRALVSLYLPSDPIGFIKTPDVLAEAFARHFETEHDIRLRTSGHVILFGASRSWTADAGGR